MMKSLLTSQQSAWSQVVSGRRRTRRCPDVERPVTSGVSSARAFNATTRVRGIGGRSTRTSTLRSRTRFGPPLVRTAFSPGFCGGIAMGAQPSAGCTEDEERYRLGVRIGYDRQMGRVVVGALVELVR